MTHVLINLKFSINSPSPIRCWRQRTFRSWNGPPRGNNPTSSAKCTWRKQRHRFWGLLRLVMDHAKWKSIEVLWKQTCLGPWTKSRKVSSLKITWDILVSHQVDLPSPYQQLVKGGNRRSGIKSTSTIHLTASHVKFRSIPASWLRLKIGYLVLSSRPHVPDEWMPSIGTLEFVPLLVKLCQTHQWNQAPKYTKIQFALGHCNCKARQHTSLDMFVIRDTAITCNHCIFPSGEWRGMIEKTRISPGFIWCNMVHPSNH